MGVMQRPGFLARLRLDRFGIALSGLCAVHCVASLLLIGALGAGTISAEAIGRAGHAHWLLEPSIHRIGLALALAVGALTIGVGVWRHGKLLPMMLGGAGLALMALALAGPHGMAEAALTISGVIALAAAHFLNLRLHWH